jgi:hypothetical protein
VSDEISILPPSDEIAGLYRERAALLALIADGYPSWIGYTDPITPHWPVLTIMLPTGQCCWRIAPDDVHLFGHVRQVTADDPPLDAHSTDEKYRRILEMTNYGE